ncbi:DUF5949 family protein [Streptomyces sp. RP5T]|uniref:DUF5949 family protein n=1 Tax=unclassified Streptomyces TaxID=2593676 RepID=UPI000F649B00|nr:DUF5949 family protein [Streptomyces sp. RP5T]RRR75729.1 hypothetical protein EHS43_32335 [Streptomyces sp. RP5T]
MTSTSSETRPFSSADLGTVVVLPWSGENADGVDIPHLLVCSLGNAEGGPEVTSAAVERLLTGNGLPVGRELVDGIARPSLPVGLLVVAGQAVLTMPRLNVQCTVPPQWLEAVEARGFAYLIFTTRAWTGAEPGETVDPDALAEFVNADETLDAAAHIVLPARSLRA